MLGSSSARSRALPGWCRPIRPERSGRTDGRAVGRRGVPAADSARRQGHDQRGCSARSAHLRGSSGKQRSGQSALDRLRNDRRALIGPAIACGPNRLRRAVPRPAPRQAAARGKQLASGGLSERRPQRHATAFATSASDADTTLRPKLRDGPGQRGEAVAAAPGASGCSATANERRKRRDRPKNWRR